LQQRLLDFTDGRQSRVTFHIPAIHCIACVWLLENLFRLHPGIGHSQVNFPRREVAIMFSPEQLKLSELVALLASIGYEPSLTLGELEKHAIHPVRRRRWLQLGVAGFAFGNIMLFSLPQYFGLDTFSGPAFKSLFGWLSLALALPVVVFSASDYWKSALVSLRQRRLTLDVPIALGLAAIYGQSAYEILSGIGEGYCDSLTGLIFLLLCGRMFQSKTQERLVFDRDYKSFFPLSVTRKRMSHADRGAGSSGMLGGSAAREERISLSQLQVGDRVIIRNHELIPADAKLVHGPGFIDYSFVTGESAPVAKQPGDYLYAGGQQIGAAIELETVKPVSQSYLTSLWNHEAFQKNRDDDLDSLTNRYSRRFTLIVIAVAVGAAAVWATSGHLARGLKAFTSVLIVACPCALALAAPFALGTAQRWLARLRIFLRNGLVAERLAQVDTIVFDKTGTLTSAGSSAVRFVGGPRLDAPSRTPARSRWERENLSLRSSERMTDHNPMTAVCSMSNRSRFPLPQGEGELTEDEARWIYSLTRHSTHPHVVRISELFEERFFPESVWSFIETPGYGLEGQVDGHAIWLGSRPWLESRGVVVGPPFRATAFGAEGVTQKQDAGPTNQGSTVHLAIDRQYRGAFVLTSVLRPEADQLVRRLSRHYELALLSGDNARERQSFRALFGREAPLHFNQSPLDKLGFIRRLQDSGKVVMMVGDGLNDAGALRQSDVGVAVVEKVGAFSPASDVILDAVGVAQLYEILKLARRTTRIVRASFGVSAAYNVVGVSIAAAGLLSPVVCAILMPLSSVTVVLLACGLTTWAAGRINTGSETFSPRAKAAEDPGALRNSKTGRSRELAFRTSDLPRI